MKKGVTVVIVAAIVVVFWQARVGHRETPGAAAAVQSLLTIVKAQADYAAGGGNSAYAASLSALATPCPGATNGSISPDFRTEPVIKLGYEIRMGPLPTARRVSSDCHGWPTYSSFYATATRVGANAGQGPAFAVDQKGMIWVDTSGTAPRPPFREGGTVKEVK